MKRKVDEKNKVGRELLECYEDIDIFDVIRENGYSLINLRTKTQ